MQVILLCMPAAVRVHCCLHSHPPFIHSSGLLNCTTLPAPDQFSAGWHTPWEGDRCILWEVHFFLTRSDANKDLRGSIHRSDSGDSLRTVNQPGCLNFCALLRRIETSKKKKKTHILVEGVAWCHRHRVDFPYSYLGFSLILLTRTRKRHPAVRDISVSLKVSHSLLFIRLKVSFVSDVEFVCKVKSNQQIWVASEMLGWDMTAYVAYSTWHRS